MFAEGRRNKTNPRCYRITFSRLILLDLDYTELIRTLYPEALNIYYTLYDKKIKIYKSLDYFLILI